MTIHIDRLAIFAADVGSSKKFGWACLPGDPAGSSIRELARAMILMGRDGYLISLGLECPLSIPCPEIDTDLGKQREGEKGKPWSAGAGANVAMFGMQQLCWLLSRLKEGLDADVGATLDWGEFQTGEYKLFLWEAFITGTAKTDSDIGDARKAVRRFLMHCPTRERPIASPVRSQFPSLGWHSCGLDGRTTSRSFTSQHWFSNLSDPRDRFDAL